jgi:hypothetical protein
MAFDAAEPHQVLGQFAVQIRLEDPGQDKFAIGAHGVCRDSTPAAALRRCARSQSGRILG